MEYLIVLLLVFVIIGLGLNFFLLSRKKPDKQDSESLLMLQQQLNQLDQTVDSKLSQSAKAVQSQFSESAKIIKSVTEGLTELKNTNKQVVGFAENLQSLENVLNNPKQRGILGEYYLEELLKNIFSPEQYQMQYQFKNGQIVDAVIFLKDKIIPIDSKFSLENYNRIIEENNPQRREQLEKAFKNDLKARIDETAKYIRPKEKTYEFAFMFIPAEAIYYDLLVNKIGAIKVNTRSLLDYAVREKHIHIVSPTSFFAYLQTILEGLRGMQIEESTKEIIKLVGKLDRHVKSYSFHHKKLGNSINASVNTYNRSNKELQKIDKDVSKIASGKPQIETEDVANPLLELDDE
ncbi:MAG: DNA recombination protein RmuC [Parcubacteria group bacterium]|nr:DNA recombination protein RmuC [Parcubacteria group bacterium]|tara:strand:+ start:19087 stop:20133 length:1047 start_codon:yes stop_codon:yes gene_type:complete